MAGTPSSPLFRFVQVELPWRLGPPDGRYLLRAEGDPEGPPAHVLVIATLGAPQRRRLIDRRRARDVAPGPEPEPVATGRATIIDAGRPLAGVEQARAWLAAAGEDDLAAGVAVLNRALHAFRLATADPDQHAVARRQAIAARVGFGAGEEVADGLWTSARELAAPEPRHRRRRVLEPQARLAALLGSRVAALACEELALRARLDLDHARPREAALQVLVALDAAVAELAVDPHAGVLAGRLAELRGRREPIAAAAQSALGGTLSAEQLAIVDGTLSQIEAALRARAVADS
ncbi:MAG: hypothetical protein ABSH51_10940 [Solirubrobacteraceae bacterium]